MTQIERSEKFLIKHHYQDVSPGDSFVFGPTSTIISILVGDKTIKLKPSLVISNKLDWRTKYGELTILSGLTNSVVSFQYMLSMPNECDKSSYSLIVFKSKLLAS